MKKLKVTKFELNSSNLKREDADYLGSMVCDLVSKINSDAESVYIVKVILNNQVPAEHVANICKQLLRLFEESGAPADRIILVPCCNGLFDIVIDEIKVTKDE